MDIETRAAFLRAARAFLNVEQAAAALGAGIAWNTLIAAEKGRTCSNKSWTKLVAYYRSQGLVIVENDELEPVAIRPV